MLSTVQILYAVPILNVFGYNVLIQFTSRFFEKCAFSLIYSAKKNMVRLGMQIFPETLKRSETFRKFPKKRSETFRNFPI